jgi:hypothetical protein
MDADDTSGDVMLGRRAKPVQQPVTSNAPSTVGDSESGRSTGEDDRDRVTPVTMPRRPGGIAAVMRLKVPRKDNARRRSTSTSAFVEANEAMRSMRLSDVPPHALAAYRRARARARGRHAQLAEA